MNDEMRPDIADAWSKVSNKTGKKRDVRKLIEYLNHGERVIAMAGGRVGNNLGLLVATDRRALFVSEGVINHSFEDFPYDRITTITSSRGMLLGKVIVHTGGAARVIDQMGKGEAEAVSAVIRERVEATTKQRYDRPPPMSAAPQRLAPPPVGIAAELRELAALRDSGVLTHQEFERQKARLLGR